MNIKPNKMIPHMILLVEHISSTKRICFSLLIILISFSFACNRKSQVGSNDVDNSDSLKISSHSKIATPPEKIEYDSDTCELASEIVRICNQMVNETSITKSICFELENLLARNDTVITRCKFPRNSEENTLLLKLTKHIAESASNSPTLDLFIGMSNYFKNNVEYREVYIYDLVPEVVVSQPYLFIERISMLKDAKQNELIEGIGFIKSENDIIALNDFLNNLNEKRFDKEKSKILKVLKEEYGPLFEK